MLPSTSNSLLVLTLIAGPAFAADVGVAITQDDITFFDTQALAPIATVQPPPQVPFNWSLGDAAVSADGELAYVSRQSGEILVYDLTLDPPALASGINIIPVPTNANDIEISPDGRFLAVTGWDTALGGLYPISVVDLQSRTVADSYLVPGVQVHWGVAFGPDGSVLYANSPGFTSGVGRLLVDAEGNISDTGELFTPAQPPWPGYISSAPQNITIAPDGRFAVAVYAGSTSTPAVAIALSIPGLNEVSRSRLGDQFGIWVELSPDGRRLFAASRDLGASTQASLRAFAFDPVTGSIDRLLWSTPVGLIYGGYGRDPFAVDASGRRIFGAQNNSLLTWDARHGGPLFNTPLPPGIYVSTAVAR